MYSRSSAAPVQKHDPDYPHNALHVCHLNKDVDKDNIKELNCLTPKDQQVTVIATDNTKDKNTRQLNMTKS